MGRHVPVADWEHGRRGAAYRELGRGCYFCYFRYEKTRFAILLYYKKRPNESIA